MSQEKREMIWSQYEKVECLGSGTYGEVFKAVNRKNQKAPPVAIKVLKNTDTRYEQFCVPYTSLREVTILKNLHHPCLAR